MVSTLWFPVGTILYGKLPLIKEYPNKTPPSCIGQSMKDGHQLN